MRGADKGTSSDGYYLLDPAWSGDIASPTFLSFMLDPVSVFFKVWIVSVGTVTPFSFFQ